MRPITHTLIALLWTSLLIGAFAQTATEKEAALKQSIIDTQNEWTAGLKEIPRGGTASCLVAFNCFSYPVIQTSSNSCGLLAGAVNWARGRVAALAHNNYLSNSGDFGKFRGNVRKWVARREVNSSEILNFPDFENNEAGFLKLRLARYKVIEWSSCPKTNYSEAFYKAIDNFVRNGGGLIVGYPGWVISAYCGYSNVSEAPINKLLNRFGLHLSDGYLDGDIPAPGVYPQLDVGNAYYATLSGLKKKEQQDSTIFALQNLPITLFAAPREITSTFSKLLIRSAMNFPIEQNDYIRKIGSIFVSKKNDNIDAPLAAPLVEKFPGAVLPNTPRVTASLLIQREEEDSWISTGHYLAAGEVLTVQVVEGKERGWRLRIGCHSDHLYHKEKWYRYPEITKSVPISGLTRVTSPFGGLVYLESTGEASQEKIRVQLTNVVVSSFFDINNPQVIWNPKTGSPLAEIQGKYLTMVMPADKIRNENNPKRIAEFWDKIVEKDHELRGTKPKKRERFVGDIDISAGYMHSGYPIMTWLDVVTSEVGKKPLQIDIDYLEKFGSWGHFHEIGHNMQRDWWTFEGTGEVTNNIFSLWGGHICCNIPVLSNEWIKDKYGYAAEALNKHINSPKEEVYQFYQGDPGIFLVQYALIQHYFGWEAYRRVFSTYESNENLRPSENQDKIDTWVKQLSIATGKNLLAYYDLWRMPVSEKASQDLNNLSLPLWLPPNDDIVIGQLNQDYVLSIRSKYNL